MIEQKRKKKKYQEYDYESAYVAQVDQMSEYFLEEMLRKRTSGFVYATKEITAGNQFEVEIYPDFLHAKDVPRGKKKKESTRPQKNLNDKKSRKKFIRILNANFKSGDLWITLTYDDEHLPDSIEDAEKDIERYIKRINYHRKKKGLSKVTYLVVTEWIGEDGECVRCHHHVVMDGMMEMDMVEKLWKLGKRNELRRIDYSEENGLIGLGNYMTKVMERQRSSRKHMRAWKGSTNLIKPEEKKNHYKFPKRKVNDMVRNNNMIEEYMKKEYPDYVIEYTEQPKFNEINCLFYIYVRMRRRI